MNYDTFSVFFKDDVNILGQLNMIICTTKKVHYCYNDHNLNDVKII